MKFYHKLMFCSVLLINICLRYPNSFLEQGTDSFENHLNCQKLIDYGFDNRFVNTLAFFGLFPGSSTMGPTFLLGIFSLTTGLSVLSSIFLLTLLFGLISCFVIFLFTREFTTDVTIVIFSMLIFSTSRSFLAYTEFTYSHRTLYQTLLPLFLFILVWIIKSLNNNSFRYRQIILGIAILFVLASAHHLIFLNGTLLIALIVFFPFFYFLRRGKKITLPSNKVFIALLTILVFVLYISPLYGQTVYERGTDTSIQEGKKFFDEDSLFFTIINLSLLYSMGFGILLPFAVLGYFSLFRYNPANLFLILVICCYSLFWIDLTYGFLQYLPVITVLVSLGLKTLIDKFKNMGFSKAMTYSVSFVIIILIQTVPEFIVVVPSPNESFQEHEEYERLTEYDKSHDAGVYLKTHDNSIPLVGHRVSSNKISVYSDSPYLPESNLDDIYSDNPYILIDPLDFASGNLNYLYEIPDELQRNMYYDIILSKKEWDAESSIINLNYIYKGKDHYILALYHINPDSGTDEYGALIEIVFFNSAIEDNYKFYDNGFHNLYYLDYR